MHKPARAPWVNFHAVAWAIAAPIAGLHRLALIEIARHANHAGRAWPSVATLAALLGVSQRHTRRILAELVAAGLITRIERPGTSAMCILASDFPLAPARFDETNSQSQDTRTFASSSPATPDMGVLPSDSTPDMDVLPPRTPVSYPPPDMGVRGRRTSSEEKQGRTSLARSAQTPSAGTNNSRLQEKPKQSAQERANERTDVALAWDSLLRHWKKLDLGPITPGRGNAREQKARAMRWFAPAIKEWGRYDVMAVIGPALERARRAGKPTTLETVAKKALAAEHRRLIKRRKEPLPWEKKAN